jgi:DNA-binding protein HU-beta
MNKTQLASVIAEAHGLTKTQAADILDTTLGAIVANVSAGEDVALHGFGAFRRHHKPARTARNPQTGDPVQVAAKDVPKFIPAGAFEESPRRAPAHPTRRHHPS